MTFPVAKLEDLGPGSALTTMRTGRLRQVGIALFACQLVGLWVFSYVQYRRFALTTDFAQYAQAWFMIAHGHLNAWDSITKAPFWQNNGEFVLWPLALLYYVNPHAVDLLWVQDAAVVAAEVVAFMWAMDILEQRAAPPSNTTRRLLAGGLLVCMLFEPWAYQTIAFDFHTEPLAAFFTILSGWCLWKGRGRHALMAGAAALLCYGPGGLYVAAVGLSAVWAARSVRRYGVALVVLGLAWVVILSSFGGDMGSGSRFTDAKYYGYLTGFHRVHFGTIGLAMAMLGHPVLVGAHLAARWPIIAAYLVVGGVVGVCSKWAFPTLVAVFLPSALAASLEVMKPFQIWPAIPFMFVGSVELIMWLADRWQQFPLPRFAVAAWLAGFAPIAVLQLPSTPQPWTTINPQVAADLASIRSALSSDVEVVVSQGISGRFALRPAVESFSVARQQVPITEDTVAFIFSSSEEVDELSPSDTAAAERDVARLGGRPILHNGALSAYLLSDARRYTSVTLP